MSKKYLTFTFEDKENDLDFEYVIFFDREDHDLKKIDITKNKIIGDGLLQFWHSRFILFLMHNDEIIEQNGICLTKEIIKRINEILILFAKDLVEDYLNLQDNLLEYSLSIDSKNDETYLVRFKDYPFIIGSGKTKSLAVKEAEENLKIYFEYKYNVKLN